MNAACPRGSSRRPSLWICSRTGRRGLRECSRLSRSSRPRASLSYPLLHVCCVLCLGGKLQVLLVSFAGIFCVVVFLFGLGQPQPRLRVAIVPSCAFPEPVRGRVEIAFLKVLF